jgi:hypothetical protein
MTHILSSYFRLKTNAEHSKLASQRSEPEAKETKRKKLKVEALSLYTDYKV